MKHIATRSLQVLGFVAASLVPLSTLAAAESINAKVDAALQSLQPKIIEWRRDLHQNPELSNREFRTSKIVAEHLRSLGLKVETGVAITGVVAVLEGGKPGPTIALRADMDALPVVEQNDLPFRSKVTATYRNETVGVMHACGHDVHTSVLMGVAQALASVKEDLPGKIVFLFQPAEEGAPVGEEGGASLMVKEGVLERYKPEAVFGLHVFANMRTGMIGYRGGPLMAASDSYRIVVKGRQTHGARPWGGVDPIVVSSQLVGALQTIVSRQTDITANPAIVTVGAIKGGIRYNIIPDSVELIGTIRSFDNDMRDQAFKDLENVAQHVAAAHGATAISQIPDKVGNPVTVNNPALTAQVLPSLRKAAGADNVVEMTLTTGAEDFAYYANEVPGFFYFVGATPKGQDPNTAPSNHSPQFFLDESALPLGTRTLLQVAVDYLNKGE